MSDTKNRRQFVALTSLGFAYGIIYLMPYMKTIFYDSMLQATGFTNEQLGGMMTAYTIATTLSYLPGGWISDKVRPRTLLTVCLILQGIIGLVFLFFHQNYQLALLLWVGSALCGGFAFWPSMLKAIRTLGTRDDQGRLYGIFEAINGFASMVSSWAMVAAATWMGHLIGGFSGAVLVMSLFCFFSAAGVFFCYKDTNLDNEPLAEEDKIQLRDFAKVIVMPKVWLAGLLLFVGITMYAGLGYVGAYSTEVVGLGLALAGFLSSIREYGCRVGGIGGGYMADKVFHSSAKWQVVAQALTAVLAFSFLLISPANATFFIVVMLVFGLAVYANRVTCYSLLSEFNVDIKVGGTALALITLIGYIPDMYVHAMFGRWLDQYGAAGYQKIFTYLGSVGCIGVLLALVAVYLVKKAAERQRGEAGTEQPVSVE